MERIITATFGSIHIDTDAHPNKMSFKGVLVRIDEASDKPPNGSEGHRILVPRDVAEKRLNTLRGMGLNYTATLDGHAQRRKVGVIDKAWIEGKNLCVQGHIWKHDFPEAQHDLKRKDLGMSMEIGNVDVEDVSASVWRLSDFYFLGATILTRDAAAYHRTAAIAAKADQERTNMAKVVKKPPVRTTVREIAEIAATAAAEASVKPILGALSRQIEAQNRQLEIIGGMASRIDDLEMTAEVADDEEAQAETIPNLRTKVAAAEEGEEAAAAKHKEPDGDEFGEDDDDDGDGEDDDEMESVSSEVNKGDLDEMGPDTSDPGDDTPGKFSEKAKNKGEKSSSEDGTGKNVSKGVTGSAVQQLRAKLATARKKLAAATQQLAQAMSANADTQKRLRRLEKQVSAAAERTTRKSIPAEVIGLLRKNNLEPLEMVASGAKMTVQEADAMLGSMQNLDNVTKMEFKNKLRNAGLLEDGMVQRGYGRN